MALMGERIPSIRDLAVQMEVNPNTVTRTYTMLQDEGPSRTKEHRIFHLR